MNFPGLFFAAASALTLPLAASAPLASSQAAGSSATTIWRGVYKKPQARRGHDVYTRTCSRCHAADLRGSSKGPAIVGDAFFDRWKDFRVRWLFEDIRFAMPHDFEVFISPNAASDVTSFVLERNGAPAGKEELPSDIQTLEQILVTAPRKTK